MSATEQRIAAKVGVAWGSKGKGGQSQAGKVMARESHGGSTTPMVKACFGCGNTTQMIQDCPLRMTPKSAGGPR